MPNVIRYYQVHGRYPNGLNYLPGICGMLHPDNDFDHVSFDA